MPDLVLVSEDKTLNKTEESSALGKAAFYWRRQRTPKEANNEPVLSDRYRRHE